MALLLGLYARMRVAALRLLFPCGVTWFFGLPHELPPGLRPLKEPGATSSLLAAFKTMRRTASRFNCIQRLSSPRLAARRARLTTAHQSLVARAPLVRPHTPPFGLGLQ